MSNELRSLVSELTYANEQYHNGEESQMSDAEYDAKLQRLKTLDPAHVLVTGVGSDVRGDKVTLPFKMGSLDQVYENDTMRWVNQIKGNNENFVLSTKLDGVSCLVVYNEEGNIQIAYSRGNGLTGSDITRHVNKIPNIPLHIDYPTSISFVIRSEVIMSKSNFVKFCNECTVRNYKTYKNPRNAVAGLLNSKTIPDWIYKYLDVIAFEYISDCDKSEQLHLLVDLGFAVTDYVIVTGENLYDDYLTNIIKHNKTNGRLNDYQQDGLVIDINDSLVRKTLNPSKDTLNPAYTKKFKIREDDNIVDVRVIGVEWSASKHGLLKPRINIYPVNIGGVTIDYATGFNAKFILDNYIGKGAIVKITRSGDVIPHILDVITPAHKADVPDKQVFGDYTLNETEVDFILTNPNDSREVLIKDITSFFSSLDISKLKEGSVVKLIDAGFDNIPDIINMNKTDFILVLGKNGEVVYNSLNEILSNITEYDFMGSLNVFGQGLGKRMFKKLYQAYGQCENLSIDQIIAVDGFEFKTACKIIDGMNEYLNLKANINKEIRFVTKVTQSGKFNGQSFVFSGFRDKLAQERIEEQGGIIGSSISKNTTYLVTKDPNGTSAKLQKARVLGINILGVDDMMELLR